MARKIMLIRHAEKPARFAGPGLLANGEQSEHGLTVRGWQRAGALAALLGRGGAHSISPPLVAPNVVFAAAPAPHSPSLRMLQTTAPLVEKLAGAVTLRGEITEGEEERLTAAAMGVWGDALICWPHERIPTIASLLLGEGRAPRVWPQDRYDMFWLFERDAASAGWRFQQTPQLLLAGDSDQPIA